ncbi:uncharacterized protein LOC124135329 [Haliotis rufescens]|uniref:uncharacterized protein LOC124135329 n=1 Tax=Haliotis rufescens TaxID=6454 RepID=UPI00201ED125|nr:uncharacterized protein LOC124135329 [Haliotis rufescens]XP_046356562.2 uncharacterized protein LOC124135329 [Haliotis rufescens]
MGNCFSSNGRSSETDPAQRNEEQGRQSTSQHFYDAPVTQYNFGKADTVGVTTGNPARSLSKEGLRLKIDQVESTFVDIQVLTKVKDILKRYHHVAIIGSAGDGKTSIAAMLCGMFMSKYEALFVEHIDDFDVEIITTRCSHMLVVFDDIFDGCHCPSNLKRILNVLANSLTHDASSTKQKVTQKQKDSKRDSTSRGEQPKSSSKLLFIFTSRTYNWNRGCSRLHQYKSSLFRPEAIVDMTNEYWTAEEKKGLLHSFMARHQKCELSNKEIQNIANSKNIGFGFPLMCSRFFPNPVFQMHTVDFFQNPVTCLRGDLDAIIREDNSRSAALILLILCEGKLNLVTFQTKADFKHLFNVVKEVVESCTRTGIGEEISNFKGTYCTVEDHIASFSHPSVYDAAACALSHLNLVLLLQYCTLKFLHQRVRLKKKLQTSTTDDVTNMIYITPAQHQLVVDRLSEGIRQRCFQWTVTHPVLSNDTIASSLVTQLGDELTTIAQQRDKTSGKCFLHWVSKSNSDALFRGALSAVDRKHIKETQSDIYESAAVCVKNYKQERVVDIVTLLKQKERFNVDYKLDTDNDKTLLLIAAEVCAVDIFNLFINERADVSLADRDGHTSLHYTCKRGNTVITKNICELVPDIIDVRDTSDQRLTPALIASEMGEDKVLQLLVSKGADVTLCDSQNRNCLHVASCGGHLSTVTYLLGLERFNINCKGGASRQTPVMMAALNGHDKVYDHLVNEEADLSLCDTNNRDCLMLACEGGNPSIVKHLLSKNTFDINRKGRWDSQTAVMLAAKGGHYDVYNLLVTKEADLLKLDLYNSDCLTWACSGGNVQIVRHMLSTNHYDINKRNDVDQTTPVMQTMYLGYYDVFNLLVAEGADLSLKDANDRDCLMWACAGGNASIVKRLLHLKRFDINRIDSVLQQTPLMMAKAEGFDAVFDVLVSEGADLSLAGN